MVLYRPPHTSKQLKEFFRQSRVGSNEFPLNLKLCAHFRAVPFTGLYKHSKKLGGTIEPLTIYAEVIKKIQTFKLFGGKTTEQRIICQIIIHRYIGVL